MLNKYNKTLNAQIRAINMTDSVLNNNKLNTGFQIMDHTKQKLLII